MARLTIAVFIILMLTSPLFAQNLLVNPTFDTTNQLDGWSCISSGGLASWSLEDRTGSPGSGSLQHDVEGPTNNSKIWCAQCVPVTEFETYTASGWHFWPDDPDVDQIGSSRFGFNYYAETDCTIMIEAGPLVIDPNPTLDTWHFIETQASTAPAAAMSADVYFLTWQNVTGQPVRVRLDDLDFSIKALFRDGFESGDFASWSFSTP